jgi:hypothetical protein
MGRGKSFGFSWSWKRASGLSAAKGKLSRRLGVPLTRSGRQRKLGREVGLGWTIVLFIVIPIAIVISGRQSEWPVAPASEPPMDQPKPLIEKSTLTEQQKMRPVAPASEPPKDQPKPLIEEPPLTEQEKIANRAFEERQRTIELRRERRAARRSSRQSPPF